MELSFMFKAISLIAAMIGLPWLAWRKLPSIPDDATIQATNVDTRKLIKWHCAYHIKRAEITIIIVGAMWGGCLLLFAMMMRESETFVAKFTGYAVPLLLVLLIIEWLVIILGHLAIQQAKEKGLILE